MTFSSRYRTAALVSLVALLFAASHLAYEHFNGGVRGHHVLNRSDLPVISNWFGLIVLPVLGWLLGMRLGNRAASHAAPHAFRGIWIAFGAALLYGAALAAAFEFNASAITSGLFFGLFLLAVVVPFHRAEYVLGFVVGMTFTFGGVLPALIAALFATISFVVRAAFRWLVSILRPSTGARGAG